ncbi:MAG: hypothetical protein WD063_16395 [Pirellulales bacterium]
MPQPTRFAVRDALGAARFNLSLAPLLLAAVGLGWLLAGVACLALRVSDAASGPVLAPAAVVLVACSLVQLRLTLAAWHSGRLMASQNPLGQIGFWRSLLFGALLAYLAALAVGPVRYLGCAWIAAVCGWQTLLMLPLAASPNALANWRKWTRGHTARWLAWLVYASILILFVSEAGLRARRIAVDGMGFSDARSDFETIDSISGIPRSAEPLQVGVARLKGARFRVAMLGDPPVCGCESDGCPARIEQTVPGVEIVPLAASLKWPGARADELSAQVRRCDPDLVLAVLSVCEDLSREPARCGYFDWRQFELANLLVDRPPVEASRREQAAADNFESFLRGLGPQLAACRTPIDEAMRSRWNRIFASLDELIAGCRDAGVPLALVIVPAEFQVNRALRETLLRRHGLSAARFDVELPQRRLAGFAEHRNLPLVDLLPHFRLCRQSVYRRNTAVLTEEGNAAAASAIGGWLQSRYSGQLAAQLSAAP